MWLMRQMVVQKETSLNQNMAHLRRWQDGDWFVPFGMSGRKKLSDFLIDKKVSLAEKRRQFVLMSGDDIVWVVGRRLDDRYAITRKTENVLKVVRDTL